jgi:predicted nucleic acid-binding protein
MIVVSDAGPLIALAKVDRLHVLQELFDEICIPLAVHRELFAKLGLESSRLEDALQDFVQVAPSPTVSPAVAKATSRLHPGEREAIALAFERKALLLADDQMGRSAARRLGLAVTGVVGVLLRAKEAGHLETVGPVLVEMRQRGYWLSDEILVLAARLAGES